ncbi:MAG: TrkA family potassium uptake protein [Candidatus Cloacimonetes bacterium]|nr:TrkA family potassium uptake protein [Candidatus Cloacimonadota bacterium]
MSKYAVIGLGKFGMTVAVTLFESGAEVIAIDSNRRLCEEIKGRVTVALNIDSTDEYTLREQRIQEMDAVVLAIGNSLEVSILTTVLLKKLGVANIYAKVDSKVHARILEMIGVQHVVFPEEVVGIQTAYEIISNRVLKQYTLGTGHTLIELEVPQEYVGKSLQELALPSRKGINVVAIKYNDYISTEDGENKLEKRINDLPGANDIIEEGDILVLIGPKARIAELIKETAAMKN